MPKVSILLTPYNHGKSLRETIDSALSQTFPDFELIIWGDASSDDCDDFWNTINSYSDTRIRIFSDEIVRKDVYGINTAISEIASGEYIAMHHSGCVWELDKLEKQVAFLDGHSEIGAVFTHALAVTEDGSPLPAYSSIFDQPNRSRYEWLNHFFYHDNVLCHPSVLIRKQCYSDCGMYTYERGQVGTLDMWIRLCLKYEIYVLQQKLVKYRVYSGEASTSDMGMRNTTESFQPFTNYLKLGSYEEFVAVFPEAERFFRKDGFIPEFVLAMLALGPDTSYVIKTFGILLLFSLLSDDNASRKTNELYCFDYQSLIKLTEYDKFLSGITQRLKKSIDERDEQIARLNHTVSETRRELVNIKNTLSDVRNTLSRILTSKSWKITRPLRTLNGVVRWRQLPSNKLNNHFKTLAFSLRERGIVETASRIATRTKIMAAMSQRVEESWTATPTARFTADLPRSHEQFMGEMRRKVTLISMVRNEKNIVENFCAHALSLFDRIILVDHLSSDGTKEYVKLLSEKYPSVEYFCFEDPGYYQSELMTWIVRNVVGNENPGWVFILDADEFLPFKSKEEFVRKLSEFSSFPVISMPWLNLIPLDMESGRVIDALFLKPPTPSSHCKVAFQPSLIPLDDYIVEQGNHALLMGGMYPQRLPMEYTFPIYHLPIRTKQQLREKILQGVESYGRMGKDRTTDLGFHWDEIKQIMDSSSLTNEMMAGIAARYGDPLAPPYERGLNDLRKNGYSEMRMDICFLQLMVSFRDIEMGEDYEIKKNIIASTSGQPNDPRNISLDPVTHSLRFSS